MKRRRYQLLWLLIFPMIFLSFNLMFEDNDLRIIAISLLPIFSSVIALMWLTQTVRRVNEQKVYWFLLLLAIFNSILGNIFFSLSDMGRINGPFVVWSNVFWVLCYLTFLTVLVKRTKSIGFTFHNKNYIFNIVVYMIMATSVSHHYLVGPYIALPDIDQSKKIFTIGFEILDLAMLFFSLLLYYLVKSRKIEKTALFLVLGILCQLSADTLMVFQYPSSGYSPGGMVDLLWTMMPLIVGLTGLLHEEESEKKEAEAGLFDSSKSEFYLPYASAILLVILVTHSYHWELNMLSSALSLIFLLIVVRQYLIIQENETLLKETKYLALHDSLTGMANRYSFMRDIEKSLQINKQPMALYLIDLDRFKHINDSLGHLVGDKLLISVAKRIEKNLGEGEKLYRLGGDEFVVLKKDATLETAHSLAEQLVSAFSKEFWIAKNRVILTPSIGISLFPSQADNGDDLLKYADVAMYHAKEKGKNNFVFYDVMLMESMVRKLRLETEMQLAIERNEFYLVYQPKVNLKTNRVTGVEVLIRWEHPELGFISPEEFIPIAEETGMIVEIGAWVLENACLQMQEWVEKGFDLSNISINVSGIQLRHQNFIQVIEHALALSGLSPEYLELEITETIMQNKEVTTSFLEQLKNMGVKSSIDDFGTGYSSLQALHHLPIDVLKIDRSFVMGLTEFEMSPMVKTMIELGLNLGLEIVAEGIETEYQLMYLQKHGCHYGQGYFLSKPLKKLEFEKYIDHSFINDQNVRETELNV